MRIYETKRSKFVANNLEELKQHWLKWSKIYKRTFSAKDYKETPVSLIGSADNLLHKKDRNKYLSTLTMMRTEYPLSKKYPYEFVFDLNPTNFTLRFARKKKDSWYFIFSHPVRPIRLAYKASLVGDTMTCTCISGYEFNQNNKFRGVDFNFMKDTKSIPMGYDEIKIIRFTSKSCNSRMHKSSWIISNKYITKVTMTMMEMEHNKRQKAMAKQVEPEDWF